MLPSTTTGFLYFRLIFWFRVNRLKLKQTKQSRNDRHIEYFALMSMSNGIASIRQRQHARTHALTQLPPTRIQSLHIYHEEQINFTYPLLQCHHLWSVRIALFYFPFEMKTETNQIEFKFRFSNENNSMKFSAPT